MTDDENGVASTGLAATLLSCSVDSAEGFRVSVEEAKAAERDRMQSGVHRRQLLASLRDSVGKARLKRERLVNRERFARLVRDGVAQKVAEECQHILRSAQILKHNRQLSVAADQVAAYFAWQFKVFYEKYKLLKKTEERIDLLSSNTNDFGEHSLDSSSISGSMSRLRELAQKVRNDIQGAMEELLRIYEALDQQVERDAHEEESIQSLFCACLESLDAKKRAVFMGRFQDICSRVPAGQRKNAYRHIIEELAKKNEKVARRLHQLTRKKAREHLREGRPQAASTELCAMLRLWRDEPESYRLLHLAFQKSGETRNALIALEEAARLSSEDKDLRARIADGWLENGDTERACLWYQEHLKAYPQDFTVVKKVAHILYSDKRFKQLLDFLQDYEDKFQDVECRIWRGIANFQLGLFDNVVALLHPLRSECCSTIDASLVLATAMRQQGDYAEVALILNEALQHNPNSLKLQLLLGACYNDQAQWDEAEKIYAKVASIHSDSPQLLHALAEVKLRLRKSDEAIQYFIKAKDLNSSSVESHLALGRMYKDVGDHRHAAEVLEEAHSKLRNHAGVCQELSCVYMLMGDWNRAAEMLKSMNA